MTKTYEPTPSRKTAFLGLGVMGHPMAGHLARAGHQVCVFNRTAAKAQAWAKEYGGRAAPTPREAASGADFVFCCVGNDDDLRSVVLGEQGAFAGMKKGAIFINTSRGPIVDEPALVAALREGRIIAALDAGPVDLFASSGGAINALALVARHPEQVRTLIAHEPPLASVLPDRAGAMALTQAISDTYRSRGFGAGMAHFIIAVSHKGPITPAFAAQPGPDPAMFGLPTEDDGSRTDALLGQNIVTSTHYEPDFDALRAASTRIVIAAGAESKGEMAHRGAEAVAERLDKTPVIFPSGHGGFLGGEYGQTGEPDAFAAKLREVLAKP